MDAALITVSYRGDFELARDLARSVDEFVDPAIEHVVIVPHGDLGLFKPLASSRRRLVASEDVLGGGFHRLPTPHRLSLPFYSRRLRDFWLRAGGISRGWIVQQLIKLSSNHASDRQALIFADSDIVFIRPLTMKEFAKGERLRLYRRPGATQELPGHRRWHRAAAKLLGLAERDYFGADYIGPLVSWRSDVLKALQDRIDADAPGRWRERIAALPAFSEYILYGVFAEHVLKDHSGHYLDASDLTHGIWNDGDCTPEKLSSFAREVEDHKIAALIQSTTDLPIDARRRVIDELKANIKKAAA
jgi:Family of unknown function (DUF6492)